MLVVTVIFYDKGIEMLLQGRVLAHGAMGRIDPS